MKDMRPSLVLGAGAVTQSNSEHGVDSLLTTARELGIRGIDTSPVHLEQSTIGHSEKLIGLSQTSHGFTISTSVESTADGRCSLTRGGVWESVKRSFQRLEVKQVDILYIHAPDSEALLEQHAAAMDDLYRQGKFKRLGVANFSLIMLKDYLTICHHNNYITPSVAVITYNLLWRFPESKLLPFYRQHGITVVADSPLAGGLLTGRFAPEQLGGTRLATERYKMYKKPCYHTATADLVSLVSPYGMTPAEASLRWLCYHSNLGAEDGVLLGGVSKEHLTENVRAVERGPLPDELVGGIERIWDAVKGGVFQR